MTFSLTGTLSEGPRFVNSIGNDAGKLGYTTLTVDFEMLNAEPEGTLTDLRNMYGYKVKVTFELADEN